MAQETPQQKRDRLQRELAALDVQQSERMQKVVARADAKVRASIDDAAATIAAASAEVDGDDAVSEEDIKAALYTQYGIEAGTPADGETGAAPVAPDDGAGGSPTDAPSGDGEPPVNGDGGAEGEGLSETEDAEEAPERDVKPPPRHWSERPMFGRKGD